MGKRATKQKLDVDVQDVQLLDLEEVSATLHMSRRQIYRLMADPLLPLPAFHIGRAVRVEKSELGEWLQEYRRQQV